MIRRFLLPASLTTLAMAVLTVSLVNASELSFDIPDLKSPLPVGPNLAEKYYVNYELPEASSTPLPVLNQLKAAGEKLELFLPLPNIVRAQIMLDRANERMAIGERYIRDGKIDMGLVTINKAQEYMDGAMELVKIDDGYRTTNLLKEISIASLKHRERLESVMILVPDNARTLLVSNVDRSKLVYVSTKSALVSLGEVPPQNPFEER